LWFALAAVRRLSTSTDQPRAELRQRRPQGLSDSELAETSTQGGVEASSSTRTAKTVAWSGVDAYVFHQNREDGRLERRLFGEQPFDACRIRNNVDETWQIREGAVC
jgi:hypothetical protein